MSSIVNGESGSSVRAKINAVLGGVFDVPIKIGTATTYGQISVGKTITVIDKHTFDDYCTIDPADSGIKGFSSYDASPSWIGIKNNDHFHAYQSRLNYDGDGSLSNMEGIFIKNAHNGAGIIDKNCAIHIYKPLGIGPMNENYGIYVEDMTTRATNKNWFIYDVNNKSYFGGGIVMGSGAPLGFNAYYNGGWKYIGNGGADVKYINAGVLTHRVAAVNSAGADAAATLTEYFTVDLATGYPSFKKRLNIVTQYFADNAAAIAGGLIVGDIYQKADGTLAVRV